MSNPKTEDYLAAAQTLQQMLDAVIDYEDELPQRALRFLAGPASAEAEKAFAAMRRLHGKGELNPAEEPALDHLTDVVMLTWTAFAAFRGNPAPDDAWLTLLSMHGALGYALQAMEGAKEPDHLGEEPV